MVYIGKGESVYVFVRVNDFGFGLLKNLVMLFFMIGLGIGFVFFCGFF